MAGYGFYLLSALFLVLYTALSWITVGLLHLSGTTEMMARTVLLGLGFAAFGAVHAWRHQKRQRPAAGAEQVAAETESGEREIESLMREAESRLAASPLGRDARIGALPLIYLMGETGSAKTSVMVHCAAEPELLAGQVYQGEITVPTRPLNVWLAQKAVFVEAGGVLLRDAASWIRLAKRLQPARLRSFFAARQQAPRAVIVCVSAEAFLKPGSEDPLSPLARHLHTRLGEISQVLGTGIAIYVLFTKVDRLAFFTEFAGSLTDDEFGSVLGVTLPLHRSAPDGVYAEVEARRLTAAFDAMLDAVAEKRMTFLRREHQPANLGRIYEFPREFRKLRKDVVRFLVALARPSQLRANPFLRGFYFTGVRPVVIEDAVPAARATAMAPPSRQAGTTAIFEEADLRPAGAPIAPAGGKRTRRTAQWLFLDHLFSDVILRDRAAMAAGGLSVRTVILRRIGLAGAAALILTVSTGMTVSFFRNRSLAAQCDEAVQGIASYGAGGSSRELPSRAVLEHLDGLRQSVELLAQYQRDGAPWSLRWGLYTGDDIYPSARRLYFNRFHELLFGSTQASLLERLHGLPATPGRNDQYRPAYDTLKAYLITTFHHDKSTREFLTPLLVERWSAGREIDPALVALARRQFDFYSGELRISNPFSSENDAEAVERGRAYLAQFNAIESIYQFMIAEAGRQNPTVNFNKQFPGSSAYVVDSLEVPGAFSLQGWKFMEEAIRNVKKFFGGEHWVLGDRTYADQDPAQLSPELRARYQKDFLANWRSYLAAAEVVRYRSAADAAQKLSQLSSNQSYLLKLFCVASENTAVPFDDAQATYQPVHYVEPQGCAQRYVRETNSAYIGALASLQASMERVATSGGEVKEDMISQTSADATSALKAVRQVAENFHIDSTGNVHGMVQKLMEDPIHYAEAALGQIGPLQLNSEGKRFCGQFTELARKYPFNSNSKTDATLDDLNGIFRPGDGKLAAFYDSTLHNYLDRQGSQYVRKPDSRVAVTPNFLRFFNRAMNFGDALYKSRQKDPSLAYTMRVLPAEGLLGVTLSLDGQELKGSGKEGESKEFTWPGTGVHGARLAGNMGGGELSFITYDGLWAAFRFFGDADRFQVSGFGYMLQWVPRQGQSGQPIRLDNTKILALPFVLDLKGAPPIFQKGYLSGFDCVSEVAR